MGYFLAGAGIFGFGALFGASLVQVSYKRIFDEGGKVEASKLLDPGERGKN